MPFAGIDSPGSYLCKWSGHLLQVAKNGIGPGGQPCMDLVGLDSLFVTKISDDPNLTTTDARRLADHFHVHANF